MTDETKEATRLLERSADLIADLNPSGMKTAVRLEAELRAFLARHAPPDMPPLRPLRQPEETPLVLAATHDHRWAVTMLLDGGEYAAKDCPCGVRTLWRLRSDAPMEFVREVSGGSSRENAVQSVEQYQQSSIT